MCTVFNIFVIFYMIPNYLCLKKKIMIPNYLCFNFFNDSQLLIFYYFFTWFPIIIIFYL